MRLSCASLSPIAIAVLCLSVNSVHAQNTETSQLNKKTDAEGLVTAVLPDVEVTAEAMPQRIYTREEMDVTPQSNRDLAGLIANNPAVRSSNENSGTVNKGSLAPESFSIHGESPYQNQFQIDGVNATNIINPHKSEPGSGSFDELTSYSQSYNIDTELLDQVDVYDNRVPVEFSGFTGGVIDAKIKKPTGNGGWKVKHTFNSSNLTQQEVSKDSRAGFVENWDLGVAGFSSNWKKNFSSLNGDFSLTDDVKGLFSFSRRNSEISRTQRVLDPSVSQISAKDQLVSVATSNTDVVDNLFSKFHTRIDGADLSLTLKYASRVEEVVSNGSYRMGVDWDYRQTSYGIGLDYLKPTSSGVFSIKFGYDKMSSSKLDEESDFYIESAVPVVGTYYHGGYGNISEDQNQYSLKLRHDWSNFKIGSVENKIYAGIDYQDVSVKFDRKEDQNSYLYTYPLGVKTLTTHHRYLKGTAEAAQKKLGIYLAENAYWRNFNLTTSLRMDRDDLLKRTNFSPRFGFDWDLSGKGTSKFGVGWSRYYGMDILGYALETEKHAMLQHLVKGGAPTTGPYGDVNEFKGLKTPYSDEWAFSFSRKLNDLATAKFQYIHRASRDGITMETYDLYAKNDGKGHKYENNGSSRSETIMLGLHSLKSVKFWGASWNAGLDFSWQDTKRNHDSRNSWQSSPYDDLDGSLINVDGLLMDPKNKPQLELSLPRKVNISWSANWAQQGVVWGNRLNWNSSRNRLLHAGVRSLMINGKSTNVQHYQTTKMPSYWSLDTMVTYKPHFMKGVAFSVEILNVLNQIRQIKGIYTNNASEGGRMQTGREIWLNASYEF